MSSVRQTGQFSSDSPFFGLGAADGFQNTPFLAPLAAAAAFLSLSFFFSFVPSPPAVDGDAVDDVVEAAVAGVPVESAPPVAVDVVVDDDDDDDDVVVVVVDDDDVSVDGVVVSVVVSDTDVVVAADDDVSVVDAESEDEEEWWPW